MSEFIDNLQVIYPNFSKKLDMIKSLDTNWDSYGGLSPNIETISLVYTVIEHIYNEMVSEDKKLPEPDISPGGDGSIQIEWTIKDTDLELKILSLKGFPNFWYLISCGDNPDEWIDGNILGGDCNDLISDTFIKYLKNYL